MEPNLLAVLEKIVYQEKTKSAHVDVLNLTPTSFSDLLRTNFTEEHLKFTVLASCLSSKPLELSLQKDCVGDVESLDKALADPKAKEDKRLHLRGMREFFNAASSSSSYSPVVEVTDPKVFDWLKTIIEGISSRRKIHQKSEIYGKSDNETIRQYYVSFLNNCLFDKSLPFSSGSKIENDWKWVFIFLLSNRIANFLFGYPLLPELSSEFANEVKQANAPSFNPPGFQRRLLLFKDNTGNVLEQLELPLQTGR